MSERRACRVLHQHRSTQRQLPKGRADEDRLVADMIELARQYGRYAGVPAASFEDTFELALRFLVNTWKMWDIGHLELRRTLLRMVFAEPVSHCRKTGLRTPKTALPFNVLEGFPQLSAVWWSQGESNP